MSAKNDIYSYFRKLLEEQKAQIEIACREAADELINSYIKEEIKNEYKLASDEFYSRSPSKQYKSKRRSIEKLPHVENPMSGILRIYDDETEMLFRNAEYTSMGAEAERGLYRTVFEKGFHGGAMNTHGVKDRSGFSPPIGTYYYRTGYRYSLWGSEAKFEAKSPKEFTDELWNTYTSGDVQSQFAQILSGKLKKFGYR